MMISRDLADVEAFDRLCQRQGVHIHIRWGHEMSSPSALFDVIRETRRFTVTDEHLRLLRRAYVTWTNAEFGAPEMGWHLETLRRPALGRSGTGGLGDLGVAG